MGQHAFKKTDMKQAQVQSLVFAVLLAAPKTVTNLMPSSIIQRLFGSDNMNLHRGKASGGGAWAHDWAKDGGEGRMMDGLHLCACVSERFFRFFIYFFFYLIFYILLKVKLLVCDCHIVFCVFSLTKVISVQVGFMPQPLWYVELGTVAHTDKRRLTSYNA